MVSQNYCPKCGFRILPNTPFCPNCGLKTGYIGNDDLQILIPPIHNIGFFNFDIDFSPYILSKRDDFKYEICSCGYLNEVSNEYCYMCGAKRSESRLSRILKHKSKPQFTIGNILCECGTVNAKENIYCEMCGKQLRNDSKNNFDNYSNFNLEFEESVFCFCGEENERFALFCKNCGLPLKNYGLKSEMSILCTCSTLNEITSDFCIECGCDLKRENSIFICVCGHKNKSGFKFCEICERPLNPLRVIKSKIVCTCGEILDWNSDFCPNCGKNIKRTIVRKKSISRSVKNIKSILR
ncbi:MAG: double zinc ribbon domain-containing protein [Methanobrevibacter sp.]